MKSKSSARTAKSKAKVRPRVGRIKRGHRSSPDAWRLRLYVAGQTPRSLAAFANLKRLCDEYLAGRYQIEVIDLEKEPELALGDQIVALPTLVRRLPTPIKRVIGDLSNLERVMVAIELESKNGRHPPRIRDA